MELWIYIIIGVIVLFLICGIRIVRPVERRLVETLGKYTRTAEQGFHWIFPGIQRMYSVNITEIRVDIEPQEIITKDKLNAIVDAVVYYKILDVKKAVYNVNNFARSVPSLARTTLRDTIGKMSLANANENRDQINTVVETSMDKQVNAWGIDIIRVELQKIEPPKDVQIAMNEVVTAENKKIAATDFATAVETKADGERRATIKVAEGKAQSIRLVADADAQRIKVVNESAQKYFVGNAQALKQLETVRDSLKDNAKIVVPTDTELVNVIGDLAGVLPLTKRGGKK